MFKDEMNALVIKQFTALNPKCYSPIKSTLEEMACGYPNLSKFYDDKKNLSQLLISALVHFVNLK